jgi:hypothetical protein
VEVEVECEAGYRGARKSAVDFTERVVKNPAYRYLKRLLLIPYRYLKRLLLIP